MKTGPVKIVFEKTCEALSISLEKVYANVNLSPFESRCSSFACTAW